MKIAFADPRDILVISVMILTFFFTLMKPLLPQGSVTAPVPVASEAVLLWSLSGGPMEGLFT